VKHLFFKNIKDPGIKAKLKDASKKDF